jgi:RNA polymerase sigma-70 factor (ECF subfamily)
VTAIRLDDIAPSVEDDAMDDKHLTIAFQTGERDAYEAIHARYETRVRAICMKMLADRHDAQEASQETFLRVYQALGRFNGNYQLGAWITRIATNVCLDQLRARTRRPSDPVPVEDLEQEHRRLEGQIDPEEVFLSQDACRRIRAVIEELPDSHRAALLLRDFQDLSYAEMAVALGISESKVKALLHRARRRFRQAWCSAAASALVPVRLATRLTQRFRPLGGAGTAREAAMATEPAASSCTMVLQQCGHLVADRVASVMTAVVVGTAAAGAGTVAISPPAIATPEAPAASVVTEASPDVPTGGLNKGWNEQGQGLADIDVDGIAKAAEEPTPVTPSSEPVVAEEEATLETAIIEPAPPASEGSEAAPEVGEETPTETDVDVTEPSSAGEPASEEDGGGASFTPAIGFAAGGGTAGTSMIQTAVDCHVGAVEQDLDLELSFGEDTYSGSLWLKAQSSLDFALDLTDGEVGLRYTGTAQTVSRSDHEGRITLEYQGSYASEDAGAASTLGLPAGGSFSARLVIDCQTSSVVEESLTLST